MAKAPASDLDTEWLHKSHRPVNYQRKLRSPRPPEHYSPKNHHQSATHRRYKPSAPRCDPAMENTLGSQFQHAHTTVRSLTERIARKRKAHTLTSRDRMQKLACVLGACRQRSSSAASPSHFYILFVLGCVCWSCIASMYSVES